MATGQNIGFLNFGVGGDDKELKKILDSREKQAIRIQDILKKLNVGGSSTKTLSDLTKAREQENKVMMSNLKLSDAQVQSDGKKLIVQQKILEAEQRTLTQKNKSVEADNKRLTAQQKIATETQKTAEISQRTAAAQLLYEQRLQTEKARTLAAEKRASLVGIDGQKRLRDSMGLTNKTILNQRQLYSQLANIAGTYFSIYQIGRFIKDLALVGGEFEKQRLSLAAILQDTEAAEKIFGQIKELAVISPFNFKELTEYTKQLSAFSIPTNELFETTKRLADISAGLGVDMNRIILAYGQVRSAAVLRGQELRQFTEAGIPLVAELAKRFSELEGRVVSAGEVFEKISDRMVPFQMIKDIFTDLTSEGGKFYNMQEIQAESLAGKVSNLRDAYDIMLDSITQANQGILKGSVEAITNVMQNWQKYWNIIKSIIVAYGTYRGILIATAIVEKTVAALSTINRFIHLTQVITGASKATAAFAMVSRSAALINPWTAFAAIIGTVIGSLILFSEKTKTTGEIIEDLRKSTDTYSKSIDENENRISKLINTYNTLKTKTNLSDTEQNKLHTTISELIKIVPQAASEFDKYGNAIGVNIEKIKQFNEEQQKFVKQGLEVEIKQGEARIKEIQLQQKMLQDELNQGRLSAGSYSSTAGSGMGTYRRTLSQKERDEVSLSLRTLAEEYMKLDIQLSSSREILSGLSEESVQTGETLGYTAEQINAAIDKLDFGDKLKDRIKVKDVTKDFTTIRKEATDSLAEIESKLKEMENAPSLFTPEQIAEQKEQLRLYTSFVDILGGDTEKRIKKQQAAAEKQRKIEENKLEAQEKLNQMEIDLQLAKDKAILSYMIDGSDKQKAIAEQSYKERLAQIDKEEKEYLEKLNKSKGLKITDPGYITVVPDDIKAGYTERRTAAEWEHTKEIEKINKESYETQKKIWDEATEAFLSNIEKEQRAINDKYDNLVERAREAGMSQSQIDQINANRTAELDQVQSDAALKLSSFYQKIFGDIDRYGTATIKSLKQQIEEVVSSAKQIDKAGKTMIQVEIPTDQIDEDGKVIKKTVTMTIEEFQRLNDKGKELADTYEKKNPFSMIKDSFEDLIKAMKSGDKKATSDALESFVSSMSKVVGAIGDWRDSLTDIFGESDLINNITGVAEGVGNLGMGVAQLYSGDIIGGITNSLKGIAQLVNIFKGKSEFQRETERLEEITERISEINEAINKQLDKRIELIKEATAAEAKYLNSLSQEQIQQQKNYILQQLENLSQTEIFGLKGKNNDLDLDELMKMMGLNTYQEFIDWWNNGGYGELLAQGYTITNKDSWQEIIDSWNDLTDAAEESATAAQEAITGISFDSLKDSLDDLIQDVDTTFEDISDSFEDHMRNAVLNFVKNEILTEALQEWYDKFSEYYSNDDVLSESEVEALRAMYEEAYNTAQSMYDDALAVANIDKGSSDESSSGITASTQSLTEETGNILASYINAVRADVAAQRQIIEREVAIMEANTTTFAQMYAELVRIQVNTLATANNTLRGADGTDEIKTLLKRITTKGSGVSVNIG